jgi:3-oxoacyl-[acyl-carrier protein] reductase
LDRPKKAFITGASRGIGRAIHDKFTAEGFVVLAPSRSELDLNNCNSIESFIEKNSSMEIDIIVNNAGINKLSAVVDLSKENIDETLQVNLKAPLLLVKGFVPGMKKRGYGRIVNISSIWGIIAKSGRISYTASKTALIGITRTMAIELARHGILVNAVCPGFIDTDLTRMNLGPEGIKAVENQIPLGRLATTKEIAELVYFLCSDKNSYLTGQAIIVDGGYTIQ